MEGSWKKSWSTVSAGGTEWEISGANFEYIPKRIVGINYGLILGRNQGGTVEGILVTISWRLHRVTLEGISNKNLIPLNISDIPNS